MLDGIDIVKIGNGLTAVRQRYISFDRETGKEIKRFDVQGIALDNDADTLQEDHEIIPKKMKGIFLGQLSFRYVKDKERFLHDINSKWFVEVREDKSMYESHPFDYFSSNRPDNHGFFVAFCSGIDLIYWDDEDKVVVPLSVGNAMDETATNIRFKTLDEAERFAEKFWSLPRIFPNTNWISYYKIKDGIIHFDDGRDDFYSMDRCTFVPPQHIFERHLDNKYPRYRYMLKDYLEENGIQHSNWTME